MPELTAEQRVVRCLLHTWGQPHLIERGDQIFAKDAVALIRDAEAAQRERAAEIVDHEARLEWGRQRKQILFKLAAAIRQGQGSF